MYSNCVWCHIALLVAFLTGYILESSVGHECKRKCEVGRPMVCEYNFTVENYFTLSRACHSCPFEEADCFRPHCISTNGLKKNVLAVNREIPGPAIEVCVGDTVRVWVRNRMEDGSATSLHWHGLRQRNSNIMDGASRLTQCDVAPGHDFRYEFKADNAGTHWWHSHTGLQLGDGLHGAFIVREPPETDPHSALYTEDRHVMVINDWPDPPQMYRYMEEMQDQWIVPMPINVLVNGRGRKHLVSPPVNSTYNATYTPFQRFTVYPDTRYRFRVIAAATRCFFRLSVDSHPIMVIASDGVPIKSATVESLIIHPGERYDFVLHTMDNPSGSFWIRIEALGDCKPASGHGAAILYYETCEICNENIPLPVGDPFAFTYTGLVMNPEIDILTAHTGNNLHLSDLRYETSSDENYTTETVHSRHYLHLRYQTNDNSHYSHPTLYPQSSRMGLLTPTINNITNFIPAIPLATQWDDVKDKRFCNASTLDTANDCNNDLCHCTHLLDVQLGQVVELFMYSQSEDPHQMHLHGYSFRVLGSGWVHNATYPDAYQTIKMDDVINRDKAGEFPRNLVNPVYKDTVTVGSKGGYAIIRFKADNPGIWLFHCHNEGHMMQGMALVFKVGNTNQFPVPPAYFPVCGKTITDMQTKNLHPTSASDGLNTCAFIFGFALLYKYVCFDLI